MLRVKLLDSSHSSGFQVCVWRRFRDKTNIRDSSVVGRAILAATTFAGGATTVSVGAWASQLGACRAPRMIVARALTGGTGAYRGVTGQENVKLLVRKKLLACIMTLSIVSGLQWD
jgi:hypothetical protein